MRANGRLFWFFFPSSMLPESPPDSEACSPAQIPGTVQHVSCMNTSCQLRLPCQLCCHVETSVEEKLNLHLFTRQIEVQYHDL